MISRNGSIENYSMTADSEADRSPVSVFFQALELASRAPAFETAP
jgi:hypothetical protein